MSESQWKQFVQLFAEKNQHLSHRQAEQMAKKPFEQFQKLFSQRGGAKRHFKIHSITGDEIEVDIDTKLRVDDLKKLIESQTGLEKDRQKLIHWKGGPDSFRQGEFMVLDNSEKLSTIPFDKDVETDLDLLLDPEEPMCQIVSIEDDVKYLSTKYEMKDPPCRLWTFLLENGEEFKVYRTNRAKAGGRYITYLVPQKGDDITTTKARIYYNIYDILGYSASTFGATARDGFVIEHALKTHETDQNKALSVGDPLVLTKDAVVPIVLVFCECGVIVDLAKMKAHLKTKVIHPRGDEKGKKFMERDREYVSNWTP
jgi:hypothetical protein